MNTGTLVSVGPLELRFPFELHKQLYCPVLLTNETDQHVAIKVKTTSPKKYCVRPKAAVILPWSTCEIIVTMLAQEAPHSMQCQDQFLIQSVIANQEAILKGVTAEMFTKEAQNVVHERKLRVVYHPLPIAQGAQKSCPYNVSTKLVSVHPSELKFPFELYKQTQALLQLTNKTNKHVAFKVKTTDPYKYCVRPNIGVVLPRSTCEITVIMQALKETSLDLQCKDKFAIQTVISSQEATEKGIISEMFIKDSGNVVEECKLRVVYDLPSNASMKLVSIDPLELKFPFELNKQMSSSLQLTNKTDNHVAFKVYTTEPKKYCVRPNIGAILPQSTCEITVYMQAQKKAPLDMQCKGKFLIRSVIASQEAIKKGINGEMFTKESWDVVEECKFKAVYVPTTPLTSSTIAQVFSSNPLGKDVGYLNGIEALRQRFMHFWLKLGQNNQREKEIIKTSLHKKVV